MTLNTASPRDFYYLLRESFQSYDYESRRKGLLARLDERKQALVRMRAERDKLEELRSINEREGLSVPELSGKIAEQDALLAPVLAEIAGINSEIADVKQKLLEGNSETWEFLRALCNAVHSEPINCRLLIADDLASVWEEVTVLGIDGDGEGHPIRVRAELFGTEFAVDVAGGESRYLRSHRPGDLEWLPPPPERFARQKSTTGALVWLSDSHRLLSSVESLRWTEERPSSRYHGSVDHLERTLELAPCPSSILEYIGTRVASCSRPITLDFDQASTGLELKFIHVVLELTTEVHRFVRHLAEPSLSDVAKTVAIPWTSLVRARWSGAVTGALAKLKYLAEEGASPRWWPESYVGHFGFRLRTRDHSWLVGELFVDPSLEDATDEPRRLLEVAENYRGRDRGRLGNTWILVVEQRDTR